MNIHSRPNSRRVLLELSSNQDDIGLTFIKYSLGDLAIGNRPDSPDNKLIPHSLFDCMCERCLVRRTVFDDGF